MLGLSVRRGRRSSSTSRARRTIEFSFDPGQGFYVSDGIDVYSAVALGTQELGGLRRGPRCAAWSRAGHCRLQEPFRALELYKGGLARRFGELVQASAPTSSVTSTGGPGGFDGVRATLFLVYGGTTRLQRLDRPLPGGF